MKQDKTRRKPIKRIRSAPYLFSLGSSFLIFKDAVLIYFRIAIATPDSFVSSSDFYIMWIFFGGLSIFLDVVIIGFTEVFWICSVYETCFTLSQPMHRKLWVYYDDIKYIGIDYGVISGRAQFWIYFSTDPIPPKYIHNITRLPRSKNTIRLQYNKKIYNGLMQSVPPKFKKELEKCNSAIRLYHLDEE